MRSLANITGRIFPRVSSLSLREKILIALWSAFVVLVIAGVHGSSIASGAAYWSPELPEDHPSRFVFGAAAESIGQPLASRALMARAQSIRSDEWLVGTPYALSQCAQEPRCPLVNPSLGDGQNMLLIHSVPVWHVASLARPGTWGYLLLGAERGLAWHWWFQPFAGFTALLLLLEIVFRGRTGLAALGAAWFCGSAYAVCWSNWPSYFVFFPALASVSAWHLLNSERPRIQIACGVLLGLAVAGFFMLLYPPWQVSLGYVFLFLFIALAVRDKLFAGFTRSRLLACGIALIVAGGLIGVFLSACAPALKALSQTYYPGTRISNGGDYGLWAIFKGWLNLATTNRSTTFFNNPSEAASFYNLFPAVFLAAGLSRELRQRMGIVGWTMATFIVAVSVFMIFGIPQFLAKITCLSFVPGARAEIAVALASIVLCLHTLATRTPPDAALATPPTEPRWHAWAVGVATALFIGGMLEKGRRGWPDTVGLKWVLGAALAAGVLAGLLTAGRTKLFAGALALLLVATGGFYNPLARGLGPFEDSELARAIDNVHAQHAERPLWICYGLEHPGVMVAAHGGRTLSGIHYYPQMDLWRALDSGDGSAAYNRYARVSLFPGTGDEPVQFTSPTQDQLFVTLPTRHPELLRRGAAYVLATGASQANVDSMGLKVVYKGKNGAFTIYALKPDAVLP